MEIKRSYQQNTGVERPIGEYQQLLGEKEVVSSVFEISWDGQIPHSAHTAICHCTMLYICNDDVILFTVVLMTWGQL